MNKFDLAAKLWDENPMHWERSEAIVNKIKKNIPINKEYRVLEYGAGTAISSFLLESEVKEIVLMDSSPEMVKVMGEKIASSGLYHLTPLLFDLESDDYSADKFDLIFTQLVLHHIIDIESLLTKFYHLLNENSYLAIADLYSEDGTFHADDFSGHYGFDLIDLSKLLMSIGFKNIHHEECYTMKRKILMDKKRISIVSTNSPKIMPRPKLKRIVSNPPPMDGFKPFGIPMSQLRTCCFVIRRI
jgi:ubiquinone/menaquinone biosynthesis C-methylase UbiE